MLKFDSHNFILVAVANTPIISYGLLKQSRYEIKLKVKLKTQEM